MFSTFPHHHLCLLLQGERAVPPKTAPWNLSAMSDQLGRRRQALCHHHHRVVGLEHVDKAWIKVRTVVVHNRRHKII